MPRWVTLASSLALIWYGLAAANSEIFQYLALTPDATLKYLPAALRLMFPLIFGGAGVWGIILGSYLAFAGEATGGILYAAMQAILSGLAPRAGLCVFKISFQKRLDLADLKAAHLDALTLLCAASNALISDFYLTVSVGITEPLRHVLTMFIGDVTGTIIVVYARAFGLACFISRRLG